MTSHVPTLTLPHSASICRAQYSVLVPALWNTEVQDWELKCINSLVLDESHHGPNAGTTHTHTLHTQSSCSQAVANNAKGHLGALSTWYLKLQSLIQAISLNLGGTHADPVTTSLLTVWFSGLNVSVWWWLVLGEDLSSLFLRKLEQKEETITSCSPHYFSFIWWQFDNCFISIVHFVCFHVRLLFVSQYFAILNADTSP